jgi:hypothetical protein
MAAPFAVYRPLYPQATDYYRCVEDCFETFVMIYDENLSCQYSFYQPYAEQAIYRYLDCGNLHNGFARVNGWCISGSGHRTFLMVINKH